MKSTNEWENHPMDYEDFKEEVRKNILSYMDEQYRDLVPEIVTMDVVNDTIDKLRFREPEEDLSVSPTMQLMPCYEAYTRTGDLDLVLQKIAETLEKGMVNREKYKGLVAIDKDKVRENVVFELINTGMNKELLRNVPHRRWNDLSVIYRWTIEDMEGDVIMTTVSNQIAEKAGLSEAELFELASTNTKRIMKPMVMRIEDMLVGTPYEDGTEELIPDGVPPLYVITNEKRMFGAAAVLYDDVLQETAQIIGSGFYLMPSSIHEMIAVSDKRTDPFELAKIVDAINDEEVENNERLSYKIYHYNQKTKKVGLIGFVIK